jgi:mannose-6-phosphate isomerase
MSRSTISHPLTFEPIFMERIWGGRKLETLYRKRLPPDKPIGESWEIVDRPEAQSIVRNGPWRGKTLHDLWMKSRREIFGETPDAPRFPLLVKLLDAQERLSLQVHPPAKVAPSLGGEPKSEFWYVAAAEAGAEIFAGFRAPIKREDCNRALRGGSAADAVHTIRVKTGDAIFLPAGRFHAAGGGNVLVEIQQNSDTTYRVFDWNRGDNTGKPRELHIDQALQCIDFQDVRPSLARPSGEVLVQNELFEVQKWNLARPREIVPAGQFAIVCCLTGSLQVDGVHRDPAEFLLVPASLKDRQIKPRTDGTTLLRITIPA